MALLDRIAEAAARLQGLAGFPILHASRLQLRAPGEDDVAPLFTLFSDARVMRYWPRPPMQRREAEAYIASIWSGSWTPSAPAQTGRTSEGQFLYSQRVSHPARHRVMDRSRQRSG